MQAQKRKKQPRTRPITDNATIKALITTYLKQSLSSDTMKGRVILEKISFPMSVETIYTIIARDVL